MILDFLSVFVIDDAIYAYLAYAAIAAAAVGAGVSYVGAQKSANAAEDAAKAQKEAADAAALNEQLQNAESIKRERTNKRRRLARMRADYGTSGVVMADSSMDVFAETSGIMELQIQDAARAGEMNAANMRNQGAMSLWEGRTQAAATRMASYGTLLSDVGSAAGYGMRSGLGSNYTKSAPNTITQTAS